MLSPTAVELWNRHARRDRVEPESLFDRFSWLYAFCREHLFRDDTDQISTGLWPAGAPEPESLLVELGCGPGFYARRLAERFARLRVVGVDRSDRQLQRARSRAAARGLGNCRFERGDVLALRQPTATVDALVASRLFTVVPARQDVLAEAHRVLRPGGRCFIAEPRSALRATVPLLAMWLLAGLVAPGSYREPSRASVLGIDQFGHLIQSQPWRHAWLWHDNRYHYAVCEKAPSSVGLPASG